MRRRVRTHSEAQCCQAGSSVAVSGPTIWFTQFSLSECAGVMPVTKTIPTTIGGLVNKAAGCEVWPGCGGVSMMLGSS